MTFFDNVTGNPRVPYTDSEKNHAGTEVNNYKLPAQDP